MGVAIPYDFDLILLGYARLIGLHCLQQTLFEESSIHFGSSRGLIPRLSDIQRLARP